MERDGASLLFSPHRRQRKAETMSSDTRDPFGARATLEAGGREYVIYRLDKLAEATGADLGRLPFSIKVVLEALLRNVGDGFTDAEDVAALAAWTPDSGRTSRGAVQAGARAAAGLHRRARSGGPGGDARRDEATWAAIRRASIRSRGADLVIDHSVQVDAVWRQQRAAVQRRARVRAQPRALRVLALGPAGLR